MLSILVHGKSDEDDPFGYSGTPSAWTDWSRKRDGYDKFVHDRVQEAAYALIPAGGARPDHLRIGRLLVAQTPGEKREEAIFEIVNQLNRGAALITSRGEREQLAELNLLAGERAKTTTAYASALAYLAAGEALLPENSWKRRRQLTFALALRRGECEFLTGAMAEAERRLEALSSRAANTVERATVACLRADLYTTLDQGSRAIAVGLDYLRREASRLPESANAGFISARSRNSATTSPPNLSRKAFGSSIAILPGAIMGGGLRCSEDRFPGPCVAGAEVMLLLAAVASATAAWSVALTGAVVRASVSVSIPSVSVSTPTAASIPGPWVAGAEVTLVLAAVASATAAWSVALTGAVV